MPKKWASSLTEHPADSGAGVAFFGSSSNNYVANDISGDGTTLMRHFGIPASLWNSRVSMLGHSLEFNTTTSIPRLGLAPQDKPITVAGCTESRSPVNYPYPVIVSAASVGGQDHMQTGALWRDSDPPTHPLVCATDNGPAFDRSFRDPIYETVLERDSAQLVYGSGSTAYTLTATAAAIVFTGSPVDPVITLPQVGHVPPAGSVVVRYNGANFGTERTLIFNFRRTNNTATDLTHGSISLGTVVLATPAAFIGSIEVTLPEIEYTTLKNDDSITIYGSVSVLPTAGSVQVTAAKIVAEPLSYVAKIRNRCLPGRGHTIDGARASSCSAPGKTPTLVRT